jgi:hypothetical protein
MDLLVAADEGSTWPTAIAAIAGAAIGGLVAFIGSWWQEQRRWSREDRLRWDPARLSAYGRFLEAAHLSLQRVDSYIASTHLQEQRYNDRQNAQGKAEFEYQRQWAEIREDTPGAYRPSVEKDLRAQIELTYLEESRQLYQEAAEDTQRLLLSFENAIDSFTKAASEIRLIAGISTKEKAELVRANVDLLVAQVHKVTDSTEPTIETKLAECKDTIQKLLDDFANSAETELTAHRSAARKSKPQVVGMARLWGRRKSYHRSNQIQ